jgi:predicted GTPase
MADLIVVNKVRAATAAQLSTVLDGLDSLVPDTPRVLGASPVSLENPERLQGARVLIVEDGPTITHGGMPHGAGYAAVQALGTAEIVDPRQSASPGIREVYARYPHIGPVLPAMGYSAENLADLAATIEAADIDLVVAGTPIDLAAAISLPVPVVRVHYNYQDAGTPDLMSCVDEFLRSRGF